MLLKRDEVDSNLKKKRGSGVVEDINDKVKECFGVEDEELSQEMGRCLKDVIKVRYSLFFIGKITKQYFYRILLIKDSTHQK